MEFPKRKISDNVKAFALASNRQIKHSSQKKRRYAERAGDLLARENLERSPDRRGHAQSKQEMASKRDEKSLAHRGGAEDEDGAEIEEEYEFEDEYQDEEGEGCGFGYKFGDDFEDRDMDEYVFWEGDDEEEGEDMA